MATRGQALTPEEMLAFATQAYGPGGGGRNAVQAFNYYGGANPAADQGGGRDALAQALMAQQLPQPAPMGQQSPLAFAGRNLQLAPPLAQATPLPPTGVPPPMPPQAMAPPVMPRQYPTYRGMEADAIGLYPGERGYSGRVRFPGGDDDGGGGGTTGGPTGGTPGGTPGGGGTLGGTPGGGGTISGGRGGVIVDDPPPPDLPANPTTPVQTALEANQGPLNGQPAPGVGFMGNVTPENLGGLFSNPGQVAPPIGPEQFTNQGPPPGAFSAYNSANPAQVSDLGAMSYGPLGGPQSALDSPFFGNDPAGPNLGNLDPYSQEQLGAFNQAGQQDQFGFGDISGTPAQDAYAGEGAFGTEGFAGSDPEGPFGGDEPDDEDDADDDDADDDDDDDT